MKIFFRSGKLARPYSRIQFFSNFLLVLFGVLLLWGKMSDWANWAWGRVVLHGLEGGLVGAICDWFAVWKTYRAVETESGTIAEQIGNWVSTDLLNHKYLKEYMDRILDHPENLETIFQFLEENLGNEQKVREVLDKVWDLVEDDIVSYLSNFQFSGTDQRILHDLNRRSEILETVRFLLGETLVKVVQEDEFHTRLEKVIHSFSFIAQIFVRFIGPERRLKEFGEGLKQGKSFETEEETVLSELVSLFAECADLYIGAWNELPISRKESAVRSLTGFGKEQMNRLLSDVIISHKNEFRNFNNLRDYAPVRTVVEFLRSKTDEGVSEYIGEQVSKSLKHLEPKRFRRNLEDKTRKVLEKIRINGSLLGLLVGGIIGLLEILLVNF
ncbi:DUF445 family protein [Leptospira perolatii]|uniref:DUF445 family protein n=1 Tax=Leptospira perolatii TaxID=2023191 RepID=UPI001FAEB44E|nr:DUF445 family protein [Leptospira perolatii]